MLHRQTKSRPRRLKHRQSPQWRLKYRQKLLLSLLWQMAKPQQQKQKLLLPSQRKRQPPKPNLPQLWQIRLQRRRPQRNRHRQAWHRQSKRKPHPPMEPHPRPPLQRKAPLKR
jgi:hypothetical protein